MTEEQTRYIYETNTILNDGEEPLKVDDILETVSLKVYTHSRMEMAGLDVSLCSKSA